MAYAAKYDDKRLDAFYRHYSQKSQTSDKMMFEEEKYWTLDSRVELWMSNQHTAEIIAASENLKKVCGKQQKVSDEESRRKQLAAERERANAELERQRAESKAGAVTREEWLAMKAERERNNEGNDAEKAG